MRNTVNMLEENAAEMGLQVVKAVVAVHEALQARAEGWQWDLRDGDMRLGVMPGDLPGVILPGVLPRASKSKSGAYCTCTEFRMMMTLMK